MKVVDIKCKGNKTIPLEMLTHFQGNLKQLEREDYNLLRTSILNNGFVIPVFVWRNKILDGHSRVFVLNKLRAEGYIIDDIPAVELEAKNEAGAKKLLLLINSHYAKITEDGLYEYIETGGLNYDDLMKEIKLPDISLDKFDKMFYSDPEETPEKLTIYFDSKDELRALKDKIGIRDSKSSIKWNKFKGSINYDR